MNLFFGWSVYIHDVCNHVNVEDIHTDRYLDIFVTINPAGNVLTLMWAQYKLYIYGCFRK